MINTADTSEKGFQGVIVKDLIHAGYRENSPKDFDKEFCLFQKDLLEFLETTAEEDLSFINQKGLRSFLVRLDRKIEEKGIIEILRKGLKFQDRTIYLYGKSPNSIHNKKDAEIFNSNIFSITQELKYTKRNENRIDLTIAVNGLPLVTMELKNGFTHQAVKNAIRQYQNTRNPKDKIFHFARCLVHFAMDTDEAFMATTLIGKSTFFFPFNKGMNDGKPYPPFGAGNPDNPNGLRTDFVWKEVLSISSLAEIIEKFAQLVDETDEDTGKTKNKLIFPRYHQLTATRQLIQHAKKKGIGQRYLIQHSAGSGKSNSIAWLAHQLTGLHDQEGITPIFRSIIVVTDRTILDEQIRENIKNFANVESVVEAITGRGESKTGQLSKAITNGKRIIITTVQTFPFVLQEIGSITESTFAIIIDEAHSSQSGDTAAKMNAVLAGQSLDDVPRDEDGNIDSDELVAHLVKNKRMLKNASYFAFTATPKNKTLETFGLKDDYGKFKPFHLYSMKQAIEEEFILDVVEKYTSYKSYYKIKKSIEGNPLFEVKKANKKLRAYIEKHEFAIQEKSRVMVDHFHDTVAHLINNRAKCMIVTKSIQNAILYKEAIDKYLKEIQSPFKSIVAFSGKKAHPKTGQELTENKMNKFPDKDNNIRRQFKKDEYRFLIVANKFQTGFDQPLLHTMYVDKKLEGVQAVQTLSRLNRAFKPYKKDTFVLDFYNSADDIKEAFDEFYTSTILAEETSIDKLNDLQDKLDEPQVYSYNQVNKFFDFYYNINGNNSDLRPHLDAIIDASETIFKENLSQEQQINFKSDARSFVRIYNYLIRIADLYRVEWEKLMLFLKHLIPKLKIKEDSLYENITESVELEKYTLSSGERQRVYLNSDESTAKPISANFVSQTDEEIYEELDKIIDGFNQRFGDIEWPEGTDVKHAETVLSKQIPEILTQDEAILDLILNSDRMNGKDESDNRLTALMQSLMFTQTGIYKKFVDDKEFQKRYKEFIFELLLKAVSKKRKKE